MGWIWSIWSVDLHQEAIKIIGWICSIWSVESGGYSVYCFLLLPSVLACLLIGIAWFRKAAAAQLYRLPPAPPALPIIGHLHSLGKLPHHSLSQLASVHGPLMSLRLGSVHAIVASSPDMAKQILQKHDHAFASRPRTSAAVHLCYNCSDIGFSPQSPYWRFMRQLCVTDLFTTKRIEFFKPIRVEEVHALVRSVLEEGAQVVQIRAKLLAATNNIISRMALGKRLSELATKSQADPSLNIVDLIHEIMHLLVVFNVGDFTPILRCMDLQGYERRMKIVGERMSRVLQEVVDSRRARRAKEEGSSSCSQDLLDVLLSVSNINDTNIKAVLTDMFIAGTDTSPIIVEWALAELLSNPNTLKTLQEELNTVVGKARLVQEADIENLTYLHAVIKETMRLHPIVTLLAHESIESCKIYEYTIPSKTIAYINVWAIGRNADVWENPLQFQPSRFLEGSYRQVKMNGQHFELLPFGSGRRKCPGLTLGLVNIHIMLAALVQGFDWALPNSHGEVDLSETYGLSVKMTSPLAAIPTPRLLTHLYVGCD